ncbi:hypothetical protein BJ508DRAFT_311786 [Ascobolus immersus RN42]|uniref:Uncharacterized protein n=1 Tax=Ascobolus immersus RN42 TaxID=1160509 RepID=A0A3N4I1C8_ASCIM|nr:hypothetical protein BJ508DRAFT_311786 [Ascobolus immersus RN42]
MVWTHLGHAIHPAKILTRRCAGVVHGEEEPQRECVVKAMIRQKNVLKASMERSAALRRSGTQETKTQILAKGRLLRKSNYGDAFDHVRDAIYKTRNIQHGSHLDLQFDTPASVPNGDNNRSSHRPSFEASHFYIRLDPPPSTLSLTRKHFQKPQDDHPPPSRFGPPAHPRTHPPHTLTRLRTRQ